MGKGYGSYDKLLTKFAKNQVLILELQPPRRVAWVSQSYFCTGARRAHRSSPVREGIVLYGKASYG